MRLGLGAAVSSPYTARIEDLAGKARATYDRIMSMPMDDRTRANYFETYDHIQQLRNQLDSMISAGQLDDAFQETLTEFEGWTRDFIRTGTRQQPDPSAEQSTAPQRSSRTTSQALPEPIFAKPNVWLWAGLGAAALAVGVGVWGYQQKGWFR